MECLRVLQCRFHYPNGSLDSWVKKFCEWILSERRKTDLFMSTLTAGIIARHPIRRRNMLNSINTLYRFVERTRRGDIWDNNQLKLTSRQFIAEDLPEVRSLAL